MDDRIMEPLRDERYLKNQNAWFEKLKDLFDGGYDGPIVLNGVSSWNVTLDADDIARGIAESLGQMLKGQGF